MLIVTAAGGAHAHPHALVVYSVVLSLPADGIDRVGFVFTFDPLFSAIILRDAGDGDAETVSRNHARILRQIPFEIDIAFNGAPLVLESPTDLRVTTAAGQVTYRFVVPLGRRLVPPGTIEIAVDDPGMFAAFALRTAAVEIEASGAFTASCERARTPSGAPGPLRCRYEGSEVSGQASDVTPRSRPDRSGRARGRRHMAPPLAAGRPDRRRRAPGDARRRRVPDLPRARGPARRVSRCRWSIEMS
jgi:ABC-type uncharacterized transport system substrate-binding protein